MFKKLFTRDSRRADIARYVEMEYRAAERPAALETLLREAGL